MSETKNDSGSTVEKPAAVAHPMRYGFVYPIAARIVDMFLHLNLVELFKLVGKKLSSNDDERKRYCRLAIDIFIVAKWLFLISISFELVQSAFITWVVFYLIFTNVFTYFYHHIWKPPYDSGDESLRSRLVSLVLSIGYSVSCFAYLYAIPFSQHFSIEQGIGRFTGSALFSVSRSFLVDFSPMHATSVTGHVLVALQTGMTFVFISLILSASIPQYSKTPNS